ncbi:hypothetical protein LTS07_003769 [Exophiala sideris]|uniref:Uncharacterized protein n=1 Tax=Exophiala sideris TaxID=1016849 RepID=A0ABR0JHV5_9EURO|nr:hypothetical protein LTS07_003769 [Exophiala sideris]KAK5042040.1 hypothetical protein LTR13_001846 [Exophiala sideris]KAK5064009.1 hypothetical protein LTR69_003777 [Exophiala sideris]
MAALLVGGLLIILSQLVPTLLVGTLELNQGSLEISKRTVTDGGMTLWLVNGVNTWNSGNETSGISLRADDGPERILMPESDLSPSVHHTFRNPDIPERIHITNVGPPICVGGFKIQYPDGTNLSINGNLGKTCHAKHYEGQKTAFLTNDPSCTWIDHTDPESSDINVNFTHKTDLCKPPLFIKENRTRADTRKRTSHVDFTGKLIKSKLAINSAARLCNDTASVGPDFAALSEGLYCDMDTKEIYPICKDGQVSGCFRTADNVLVGDSGEDEGAKVSERAVQIMKAYDDVVVWE